MTFFFVLGGTLKGLAEGAWAREARGWSRLVTWAQNRLHGARSYRHANEQANHAEQAAQTQTSIGLLAAAATHGDDEHRIQALQTEATLISRQSQLERNRAERGLTPEEMGEHASIIRGLADLHPPVASLASMGSQRLADFGAVGGTLVRATPWGLILGVLGSPITWAVLGVSAFGAQSWRIERLHHELAQAQADTAAMEASRNAYAHEWANERAQHARDVAHVLEDTAQTVEQIQRREARQRALAARERQRHEDLASGSVNFSQRLRDLAAPPDAGLSANGPAAPSGSTPGAVSAPAGPDPNHRAPQQ